MGDVRVQHGLPDARCHSYAELWNRFSQCCCDNWHIYRTAEFEKSEKLLEYAYIVVPLVKESDSRQKNIQYIAWGQGCVSMVECLFSLRKTLVFIPSCS